MRDNIYSYGYVPDNVCDFIGKTVQVSSHFCDVLGTLIEVGNDYIEIDYPFNDLHKTVRFLNSDVLRFTCIADVEKRFGSFSDLIDSPGVMSPDRFKELLDELDGNSLQTLKEKNARYAQNGDCLHNFRSGADIAGGTPAQACWGYMTKHLVALRDMVERDDFSNREDFLEKCQDTINYIRFLWCIGNDV